MPPPGRWVRWILAWRLRPPDRAEALAELQDLWAHRVGRVGGPAARRWLRREYRRWAVRALAPAGWGPPRTLDARREVRVAVRSLLRTPGTAATVVLTLGLGLGGTALVHAVADAVLLSPLPYPGGERMLLLRTARDGDMWGTSMADLDALYHAPPDAFEAVAGYRRVTSTVSSGAEVDVLPAKRVTPNYFSTLGVRPSRGRDFTAADGRQGAAPAVLVTEGFFQRVFGGAADLEGATLRLDGTAHDVVGVLPDRLGPLDDVTVFPVLRPETPERKGPFFVVTIARLRPGATLASARDQLGAVARRLYPRWRDSFPYPDATLTAVDLKQVIVGDVARTVWATLGAVLLLLAVASVNAGGLLVARRLSRRGETSVMRALGASRSRILLGLLAETGVLAGAGAAVGFGVLGAGVAVVRALGGDVVPRVAEVEVGAPVVVGLGLAAAASWALLSGLAASTALRGAVEGSAASRGATSSRGPGRLGSALVSGQLALSVPLLVGTLLLALTLERLASEEVGFDARVVATGRVTLPGTPYDDGDAVREFWRDVLPRIRALPGVDAAGLADARPPVEFPESNNFELEGEPGGPDRPHTQAPWVTASPEWFGVLDVGLVAGRAFDPAAGAGATAMVDRAWVARYSPDRPAVGRRFRAGGCTVEGCPFIEIVGVVEDVRVSGLDGTLGGTVYFPFHLGPARQTYLHLRVTGGDPLSVVPAVRGVLRAREPRVAFTDVRTAAETADASLAGRRTVLVLVTLLAATAFLVATVGVYGALAQMVRSRTREIGIRLAVGGGPGAVTRLVVGRGLVTAALGVALGLGLARLLSPRLAPMLHGVDPGAPGVFAGVGALVLAAALGASLLPARRAAATDPALVLREGSPSRTGS